MQTKWSRITYYELVPKLVSGMCRPALDSSVYRWNKGHHNNDQYNNCEVVFDEWNVAKKITDKQ